MKKRTMVQLKYRKKVDSGIAGKYKKTSQKFENEKRKIQPLCIF